MIKSREIEKKLIVGNGLNGPETDYILRRLLNPSKEVYGTSTDWYFKPNAVSKFDFIRLRVFTDGSAEVTGKSKDRGSNFNRLEINLPTSDAAAAEDFCRAEWGDPIHSLKKSYSVFVPSFEPELDVSTYVIEGVDKVFLEVEGKNEELVDGMVLALKRELELLDEPRSLYEMFVEPRKPLTLAAVLGF